MQFKSPHLFADVNLGEVRAALSEWSWLLKGEWSPLLVSSAGDVFLESKIGQVFRLDTGGGELESVGVTVDAFYEELQLPTAEHELLLAPVIDELRLQGKTLSQGQCYGFTILPIFKEGSYGAENRFVLNALEHIRFTGDMHSQLQDVPDGQAVQLFPTK